MNRLRLVGIPAKPATSIVIGLAGFTLTTIFVLLIEWPKLLPPRLTSHVAIGFDLQKRAAAEKSASEETVRFLLDRVKSDPDDFLAQNMLASSMLQKVRETGQAEFLEGAKSASKRSLASVPAERNAGGLSGRARAEMAEHDFVKAAADGLLLTRLHPGTLNSWGVWADALLELGEYAKADEAIQEMRKLGGDTAETEIRIGRILFLQGDTAGARKHLFRALAFAQDVPLPPRETVAWCSWQLGEIAFSTGDYGQAEQHYRQTLATYPGYVQALASLGRVRAARGDLPGAIMPYEEAVRRFPDPTFVAALGDLYHLAGREGDAQKKYDLVDQIARLNVAAGNRFNRQIALFYADHNRDSSEAYTYALNEYGYRKDIYGADTLAWAALKAGKFSEAQKAISEALRLSTRDARLFYHAGMIAAARDDRSSSRSYLRRALALNPGFDPLQAKVAQQTLSR